MKKTISFEKELDFPSMIGEITSISLDHSLEFTTNQEIEGNFVVAGTYKMTEASTLEEKFSYNIPVDIELSEMLEENSRKVSISDFKYMIENDDILKCNIDVLIEGVEEIQLETTQEEEVKSDSVVNNDDNDVRECDGDIKLEKEIEEVSDIQVEKNEDIEEKREETISNEENNIESGESNLTLEQEKREKDEIEENVIKEEKREEEVKVVEFEKQESSNINKMEMNTMNQDNTSELSIENNNVGSLFQAFESTEETFSTYSVYIVRKEDSLEKIMDTYKITKEKLSDYNDLNNIEIGAKIIIPTINE